jgi:hypothetical protein
MMEINASLSILDLSLNISAYQFPSGDNPDLERLWTQKY